VTEFFDTSVLVSVFWGDHPNHEVALRRFVRATRTTSACSAHSAAEVYSVLTRLPVRPPIPPEQGLLFVAQMEERLTLVALNGAEYMEAVRRAANRGATGGRIYDALLLSCARKIQATTIYTLNIADFQRLAPDLAKRIRTP
jgi:predicted nucleic acid-binding protein